MPIGSQARGAAVRPTAPMCPADTRPTAGGPRVAGRRHPGCRSLLAQEALFVAVQEAFLTETASRQRGSADRHVGNRTGICTNAD